ncbi:MAG: hypothetical protein C4532_01710 [Candidatus Abyssobacteria bacterium SURF_17]|uniref:Lysine transporter LysE n=1 Tax=Candidatus Abyssobacteria bacterium SURF_17 TaxID=2093361 RepID=A0A419F8G9_9BACT|nr:MAG: hypothetical protein C4532_01710 [Candidatus Abyssubacteria bacterium SURF_17]
MKTLMMIFFTSLAIGFTGAVMPGPLLAVALKESLSRGRTSALWLSAGHSLCELVMVGALAAGVARFVSVDALAGPVGLLGGAILVWMGIGAFRQVASGRAVVNERSSPARVHSLLLDGAAVTIANPYWLVWWLTAGLALALFAGKAGMVGIIVFYVGHITADFLWYGLVGILAGSGRHALEGKLYGHAIRACGGFLLVFGLLFIVYGGKLVHSRIIQ